jgi:hypothetical protein
MRRAVSPPGRTKATLRPERASIERTAYFAVAAIPFWFWVTAGWFQANMPAAPGNTNTGRVLGVIGPALSFAFRAVT